MLLSSCANRAKPAGPANHSFVEPRVPGGMGSVPLSVIARGSAIWVKGSPRIQDLELALKTYSSGAEKK